MSAGEEETWPPHISAVVAIAGEAAVAAPNHLFRKAFAPDMGSN